MAKRFALVFPGQGAQSLGMLAELAASHKGIQQTFAEASEVLGRDLWALCQQGPRHDIDRTELTQPLMLTAGIAVWRLWQALGGDSPVVMAGHSLGEYTALTAAQSMEFADALRLVSERGRLMQKAVPENEGAMAAVLGLADEKVIAVCEQAAQGAVVEAVNFNSPGQVVIAGQRQAVERAADAAKQAGAKRAMLLSVSVPSHCALMQPAADELRHKLDQTPVFPPHTPVVNNVDVRSVTEPEDIRDALARQLYRPVRWVETIDHMARQNIDLFLECGPGKVLTGLDKRIAKNCQHMVMGTPIAMEEALKHVRE